MATVRYFIFFWIPGGYRSVTYQVSSANLRATRILLWGESCDGQRAILFASEHAGVDGIAW
jgi:hypothetical protein